MGARLLVRVTTASRGVVVARLPARRGIALLPDVPDRQSRDGRPQRVVCRKHSVIAMPAPTRGLWDGSVAWFEQSSFSNLSEKNPGHRRDGLGPVAEHSPQPFGQ